MKLHRRKTETPGIWDLEIDGQVVGQAERWFVSPTQPRWKLTAEVDGRGYLLEHHWSIKQGLTELAGLIERDRLQAKVTETA